MEEGSRKKSSIGESLEDEGLGKLKYVFVFLHCFMYIFHLHFPLVGIY